MLHLFSAALLIFSGQVWALSNATAELSDKLDSVVAIRHYAPDHTGEDAPAFCVGTLISRNILVTAAHCLKDLYFHNNMNLQIDIGNYRYVTRPSGERVRVGYATSASHQRLVTIKFLPELMRKLASQGKKAKIGPNEDVAVAYLRQELPLPESFIFTAPLIGSALTNFLKSPVAASPKVTTINFIEESSTDFKRSAILNDAKISGQHIISKSTARVAPGDSGSPVTVLVQGQPRLVAVVKGNAKTVFSNWDVYGLVHKLVCTEERIPGCQ